MDYFKNDNVLNLYFSLSLLLLNILLDVLRLLLINNTSKIPFITNKILAVDKGDPTKKRRVERSRKYVKDLFVPGTVFVFLPMLFLEFQSLLLAFY